MLITFEPHGIFFIKVCICMHVNIVYNHWYAQHPLLVDEAFTEHQSGRSWLVKMLKTLELHGKFQSNFVYIYLFKQCLATGMQNCDKASPSIISAGRGIFSKNAHNS